MGGLILRVFALRRARSSLCDASAALTTFRQEAISRVGRLTSSAPFLALHSVIFKLDGHCPYAFLRADGGSLGWFAVAVDDLLLADGRFRGVIEAIHGWAVLDVVLEADAAQHDVHGGVAQHVNGCEVVRDAIGADGVPSVFLASGAAKDHGELLPFRGVRELRRLPNGSPHEELALPFP